MITRWRDEERFGAWVRSPAFAHGHREAEPAKDVPEPLPLTVELWSYEVEVGRSTSA